MSAPITFALQAHASSMQQWLEVARAAETAGFEALCVPDHPGSTCSPFVALAAAAAATETILLGTAVVNGGLREPMDLASDVATLDLLSAGRAFLGLGAGHTPAEWEVIGRAYPSPKARIDRVAELLATVPSLIAGETVTFAGDHVTLRSATLGFSSGRAVPIVVGGSNPRLLRLGVERADVVEFGGTGRTFPDGHYHEVRWSRDDIRRVVDAVSAAAARAGRTPVISALVQYVSITDDAERDVADYLAHAARVVPPEALPTVSDALASPFTLVGTVTEIVRKLRSSRDQWGITRYTVREIGPMAEVIAASGLAA